MLRLNQFIAKKVGKRLIKTGKIVRRIFPSIGMKVRTPDDISTPGFGEPRNRWATKLKLNPYSRRHLRRLLPTKGSFGHEVQVGPFVFILYHADGWALDFLDYEPGDICVFWDTHWM